MKDFAKTRSGLWLPKHLVREKAGIGGVFYGRILRANGDVEDFEDHNVVVYQGLDALLSIMFTGQQQLTNWYLGIYSGNYAPQAGDTANTIPGNATEFTGYSAGTRIAYAGVEGSQQVTNAAAPATYTFTAATTIYGAFLSSASGKGATSGTLFSATSFATAKTVGINDQLTLTYVIAASST